MRCCLQWCLRWCCRWPPRALTVHDDVDDVGGRSNGTAIDGIVLLQLVLQLLLLPLVRAVHVVVVLVIVGVHGVLAQESTRDAA
jgi:hypothetical protein